METTDLAGAFEPTRLLAEQLVGQAPRVALILLALAAGLIASWLARRLVRALVRSTGLEALAERFGSARLLYALGYKRGFADAVALAVWVAGLLVTLSIVAEMAGLTGIADGIGVLVEFFPRLITATVIVLGGLVAADILSKLVERVTRRREDLDSPHLVSRVVYYALLVVSFTLGAEHLGLETGLIDSLILLTAAAAMFSAGLGFALGARSVFLNLVARHYVQRSIRPGDRIALGEMEGVAVRYGPVSLWVRSARGTYLVPCSHLLESVVLVEPAEDESA